MPFVAPVEALNAALAGPAARYGARLADGFAAFRAASALTGLATCAAGLTIKLASGGCDEHPSAHGQQVLAVALQRAIVDLYPRDRPRGHGTLTPTRRCLKDDTPTFRKKGKL